jgi:hypothetical protein
MRATISDRLKAHMQQVGSAILTVTLEPMSC